MLTLDDPGQGQWAAVSAGAEHTCALDLDGRAWCWGSNAHYQLGVQQVASSCQGAASPCSVVPIPVATGRRFRTISAGRSHTCAISTDSVPFCWGGNADGQLGFAGLDAAALRIPVAAPMISIAAGGSHSCGVRTDNVIVCWGSDREGAIGAQAGGHAPPTAVAGSQRFAAVDASDDRTCARTLAGRAMCWGATWSYTSGDTNYMAITAIPSLVAQLGATQAVDVGASSACAIDLSGFAWCWETNLNGESGTGPGPGSAIPRRVASDQDFRSISVGLAHACAVAADGAAYCWGSNAALQLGTVSADFCGAARLACSTRPLRVEGRQRFVALAAGVGEHVCGVTDHANLYCWGAGSQGQRGDGTTVAYSRVPRLAVVVHRE